MLKEKFKSLKQGDLVCTDHGEILIFERFVKAHSEKQIEGKLHISNTYDLAYCYCPFTNKSAQFARYFHMDKLYEKSATV